MVMPSHSRQPVSVGAPIPSVIVNVAAALQMTLFRIAFSLLPTALLHRLVTLRPPRPCFVEASLD